MLCTFLDIRPGHGFLAPLMRRHGRATHVLRALVRGGLRGLLRDEFRDLREEVPDADPAAEHLDSVAEALRRRGTSDLVLDAGVWEPGPDGFLALEAHSQRRNGSVRVGDVVQAGFTLTRDGDGPVQVLARSYRVVCHNGAAMRLPGMRRVDEAHESAGDAVVRCLSARACDEAEAVFRATARESATPFLETLDARLRAVMRGDAEHRAAREEIDRRFARERDPSLWGLINGVTELARDTPDHRTRVRLEQLAGDLALLCVSGRGRRGRAGVVGRAARGAPASAVAAET